jgi:thiol:disulfide interchange protein DsbD
MNMPFILPEHAIIKKICTSTLWLALAVAHIIVSSSPGLAKGLAKTEPFKIQVETIPDKVAPGQQFSVKVKFSIAKGYHLYADRTFLNPTVTPGLTFGKVKTDTPIKKKDPDGTIVRAFADKVTFELPVSVDSSATPGKKSIPLEMIYQGCSKKSCFLPKRKQLNADFTVVSLSGLTTADTKPSSSPIIKVDKAPEVKQNPFQKAAARFGILGVMAAAFIWGFFASLTPCVYPMIPVTVSVIGAGSSGNISKGFFLSIVYVLGLSLVYACFGAAAAWSGSLFGSYADHTAVRIAVSTVFVLMGLSMFDIFYIQVPSAISSKLGGRLSPGIIGVFLAGGAAGAAVGPCVGPMLVGLLIYIAALGSKLYGFLIMWCFAIGMSMLFLVIGTFSGIATSLPKAGAWMERLKYFFGILMFGFALYYLKPLLNEKILLLLLDGFLIGIGVFIGAALLPGIKQTGRNRLFSATIILFLILGTAYLLRLVIGSIIPEVDSYDKKAGIIWLTDEKIAIARAMQGKKPVMIDFSADWCSACKELDHKAFTAPKVIGEAKRFVCLKIDCTDTSDPGVQKLLKKYSVIGLPTIIFINSMGNLLTDKTITQFLKPDDLLKIMSQIE